MRLSNFVRPGEMTRCLLWLALCESSLTDNFLSLAQLSLTLTNTVPHTPVSPLDIHRSHLKKSTITFAQQLKTITQRFEPLHNTTVQRVGCERLSRSCTSTLIWADSKSLWENITHTHTHTSSSAGWVDAEKTQSLIPVSNSHLRLEHCSIMHQDPQAFGGSSQ